MPSSYLTALTPGVDHLTKAVEVARQWLLSRLQGSQEYAAVILPGRTFVRDHPEFAGLVSHPDVMSGTYRDRGIRGRGPRLLVWPTPEDLAEATRSAPVALCVMPAHNPAFDPRWIAAWAESTGAELLGGVEIGDEFWEPDVVVREVLQYVVRLADDGVQPRGTMGRGQIKSVIKELADGRFELPPDGVLAHLIRAGASPTGALLAQEHARTVERGVRLRAPEVGDLGPTLVEQARERLEVGP